MEFSLFLQYLPQKLTKTLYLEVILCIILTSFKFLGSIPIFHAQIISWDMRRFVYFIILFQTLYNEMYI